jgi:hypothetical protein
MRSARHVSTTVIAIALADAGRGFPPTVPTRDRCSGRRERCCGIGLLGRPASASGRLRHADGAHGPGDRHRRVLKLPTLHEGRSKLPIARSRSPRSRHSTIPSVPLGRRSNCRGAAVDTAVTSGGATTRAAGEPSCTSATSVPL